MKKKVWDHALGITFPSANKILLKMKLTLCIILFSFLGAMATDLYSQTTKLSLNLKKTSVKEALGAIENQSEFFFLYSEKIIDVTREVNIEVQGSTIEKILDKIFAGTNVNYTVKGRQIVLTTPEANNFFGDSPTQQQKSVSGKVIDSSGGPLPGVSVVVKGTTTGTITDSNGSYLLSNVPENATLQFSFVGMKTQAINADGKTTINVTLTEDAIAIEEVVAIGYGTKSKATVTGAVETITSEQFASKPQANVTQSLQGAVPGLLVRRSSGKVGEENGIQIRGIASRSGAGVLIIIDGIPQPENNSQALNNLNPQDIESISILKDAQASIYGSRAAGGVILVTTKSGKSNKPVINYSGNFAVNVPSIWAKRANIYDQSDYYNRAFENDGITQHAYTYLKTLLPTLDRNKPQIIPGPFSDVPKMSSGYIDWMDVMYDPAFQQTHQLSVSGKSEKSNYYVSVGVLDQPGMMAYGSNYNKRYFSRLKYKFDVTDKLSISTNVSLERQKIVLPIGYDVAAYLTQTAWPTAFTFTPQGHYFNFGGFDDPIAQAEASGDRESDANRASAQFTFNYRPVKRLEIVGDYSMNSDNNSGSYYQNIIQEYNYDDVPTTRYTPNSAGSNFSRNTLQVLNLYASYKYSFQNHNLGLMAGLANEENSYKYFYASRSQLLTEAIHVLTMGDLKLQYTDEIKNQWALQSYFSRFNYDFKGKYLFEGIMRRDGSSKFAEGYRWGNYFGGSGAWIASEESFIKSLHVFDYLKFRLSYGELGNQNNVGLYDHINIINIGGLVLFDNPDSPSKNLTASTSGVMSSPTRTWETIAIRNLGIDFRVLDSRLKGSFDYFIKNTRDMLVTKEFPEVLGIAPSTVNGGEMKTNGWELSLNWSDKVKTDFNYFVNFTLADDQSEIIHLDDSKVPKFGLNSFVEGQPYNSYYTLMFDGFIPDASALTEYKKITGVPNNLRVGDARFKDLNGDGKIEYTEYIKGDPNSGDMVNIGSSTQRFQYGLTLGFDWKGIDFSAFLMGIGRWNIMSQVKQPGAEWWLTPYQVTIGKDWTENNPNSYYPKSSTNGSVDSWNYQLSDAPYKWNDAKYLRLKNVQLGYTFPSKWVNRVELSKVRVYFSGNDLWEKTNVFKGLDPEQPQGWLIWQGVTPIPRTYSIGIDITL